ncbi:MAG: patatin-like phospholipase family protein [Pseudomonadota bacterium]|nr:patatin-like phospholipase family protein [Pseudomonadota bacterium]
MHPIRTHARHLGAWLFLAAAALLAGCASTTAPLNERLAQARPTEGYREALAHRAQAREGLMVSMSFSGGGTRAAALAYGVLQELAATHVPVPEGGRVRMIDVVDSITAVSGGSYPAAYYGLFGDRMFIDFEERFLNRDVQGDIIRAILLPHNLFRMTSPYFGRTSVVAEYLDELLFEGKTFADMARAAEDGSRPFIFINASDMARTSRFEFTQDMFDVLCADLSRYPVARAVASSSAVPVVFSPITLANHSGSCGYQLPEWVSRAAQRSEASRRRFTIANDILSYTDPRRRYVHLLDGGLSDNLGVRAFLDRLDLAGGQNPSMHDMRQTGGLRRVVHIVVNAQTRPQMPQLDASPVVPTLSAMAFAIGNVTDRFTVETLEHLDSSIHKGAQLLVQRLRELNLPNPDDVDAWVIDVSFDGIADDEERGYLESLPTSFRLPADDVRRLRAAGARVLRDSPGFQRLQREVADRLPQRLGTRGHDPATAP